jgi:glycerophosphoryl diester phosphodiesterase
MNLPLLLFVAVISHRGEHLSHPENTLPAFQAAIDAGADYFELDVRTTSDGHLVLMHDATVDRTTNGKGKVREMTFEQIQRLDAGGKFDPRFAGTKVPTFEEALNLAHGKIGVYVDCKEIAPKDLVAALAKAGMSDKVVIYGGRGFLQQVQLLSPAPKVIAFDAGDFKDDVIAVARQSNTEIYVDRLWSADNQPAWQDAVDKGAAGIQTDHPAELVQYLRSRNLHK